MSHHEYYRKSEPSPLRCRHRRRLQLDAQGQARTWARRRLAFHVPDAGTDQVGDILMVLEELVSNAARHGGGCRSLAMTVQGGAVLLEVTDHSRNQARAWPGHAAGGRGLHLIAGGSERWGQRPHRDGKTVWAQLPLHPPIPAPRAAS